MPCFGGAFLLEHAMGYFWIGLLVLLLVVILWSWYQDYKNWKYHKNKPRILNPWSDW